MQIDHRRTLLAAAMFSAVSLLSSCDQKPPHYLVLCDQKDGNGWDLTDVKKQGGYIISCSFTSPDKSQSYTRACDADGCNIQ